MASLSDKLKALGVKVGTQGLPSKADELTEAGAPTRSPGAAAPGGPSPSAGDPGSLEARLGGQFRATPLGRAFVIEQRHAWGEPYGQAHLALRPQRHSLAAWAGDMRMAGLPPEAFAFLDTETTGLAGGTGTLAFLIGAGRFYDGHFHLAQFFLRDPAEEPGQLAALEAFLAPCQAIVTFNGKSFDAPLLNTRYTAQGWKTPLNELGHLDLLHLARRLWRDRLPSRTLGNLEVQILGTRRAEDDIPGWMIPDLYRDYLRTGNLDGMAKVLYHNAMDVLSLAALMDHMAGLLDDPVGMGGQFGVDLLAMARLFEDLGELEQAARLYLFSLDHEDVRLGRMPRPLLLQALQRLATLHKRQAQWQMAIDLWQQAAERRCLEACIELAKCYEHNLKDPAAALQWARSALDMVSRAATRPGEETYLPLYERRRWQQELEHRITRLEKAAQKKRPPNPAPE